MSGPPAIRRPRAIRIRRLVVRAAALDLARLIAHDPTVLDDGRQLGAAIVLGYRLNFREFVLTVRLAARTTHAWGGSSRSARQRFDKAFLLPPPDIADWT